MKQIRTKSILWMRLTNWIKNHEIMTTFLMIVLSLIIIFLLLLFNEKLSSEIIVSAEESVETMIEEHKNITNLTTTTLRYSLMAILTIVISVISIWIAISTYLSQSKTQENTRHLSKEAQYTLLLDMMRHLYRNLVITYTMYHKLEKSKEKGNYMAYPSEEHLIKMSVPFDQVHPEIFYNNDEKYSVMEKLYLNLRNYNEELGIICTHFRDKDINYDTKYRDFTTLFYKIGFLSNQISNAIKNIADWGQKEGYIFDEEAMSLIKTEATENVKKERENPLNQNLTNVSIDETLIANYKLYHAPENHQLYSELLQKDVMIECGRNKSGGEKVHLIPFQS